MINILNGNIRHVRGDTAIINISLSKDDAEYTLQSGDKAVFSIKKNLDDTTYVLQKELTELKIVLEHGDTQNLEYGDYWCDIQVTFSDGQVYTIGPFQYKLLPDVTTD